MPKLKVLHVSLEGEKGVGGIKTAIKGLLPALARKDDLEIYLVTPFFDVYEAFYDSAVLTEVVKLKHVYDGQLHESMIYRTYVPAAEESKQVLHYLIRPAEGSPVRMLFDIKNEADMYKSFVWSEFQKRVEYFNSAVAAMVRLPNVEIPLFDVVHAHTWHAGLSICLMKEFHERQQPLNKIPHSVSSVYMLTAAEQGHLTTTDSVQALIDSVGLAEDFISSFPVEPYGFKLDSLKQAAVVLAYSDQVVIAHQGHLQDLISGKGEGLDALLIKLSAALRLTEIVTPMTTVSDEVWDSDPAQQYSALYSTVATQPLLTADQLRTVTDSSNPTPTATWIFDSLQVVKKALEDFEDSLCYTTRKKQTVKI